MSFTNQRQAYGNTLVELGRENENIVVLDADLGGSTMGKLFEAAYPARHFEIGMPYVVREGTQIALFACGYMLALALEAAEAVKDTISVKVINVPTIKPLNVQAVTELAADCRAVVTAEEHSIIGGLGSAIAEALCKNPKPMQFVGVADCFGCSAHGYQELLSHYGLTTEHLVAALQEMAAV